MAARLTHLHSTAEALDWLRQQDPPLTMQDSVTQDEFSHDILVSYRDQLYLVYDST